MIAFLSSLHIEYSFSDRVDQQEEESVPTLFDNNDEAAISDGDDDIVATTRVVNNNDGDLQKAQPTQIVGTIRRRNISKNGFASKNSTLSYPTPQVPLRLRQVNNNNETMRRRHHSNLIQMNRFGNRRAIFWQLQQMEEDEQNQLQHPTTNNGKKLINVVSIRRKSQLFVFLLTVVSFIAVDEWSLLPAGTLLYFVALTNAWENWMDELESERSFVQKLKSQRMKYEQNRLNLEDAIKKAEFEYHILKNKPNVDINVAMVPIGEKYISPNNDDGIYPDLKWIVYAEPKKHRHHR